MGVTLIHMTGVLKRGGDQTQGDPVRTGRRLHLQTKKIGLRRSQCWDISIWDFQLPEWGALDVCHVACGSAAVGTN